jgi:AbrB family looped-hinge helix DNA binding protein
LYHLAAKTGMKIRIDKSGRIVVPKSLCARLGLKPGTELEVLDHQQGVLLRTVEEHSAMVKKDSLWVHRGSPEPNADWYGLIEQVRNERIAAALKS